MTRRLRAAGAALTAALVALAAAPTRAESEPTGARAQLRRSGFALEGPIPDEVVRELAAGLRSLPPALRTPPGGDIAVSYSPVPRRYGHDGDGELGPVLSATSERARFRLRELTPAETEALWWRRAAVHLVVARWDRARGWSDSETWRRVALWERGGAFGEPRPRSLDPWAVSRPEGADSPRMDFVTFAEEALAPAASIRGGAVPADATVRCQERAKWRFLFETLEDENLADYRPHGDCPAFDRWADLEHLESIEVMLVAASSRRPESLFGHLMLRPVYGPGARVASPGFQTVVQIIALTSKSDGGLRYMWRGITGRFPMVVVTTTLASVRRGEMDLEQRDVRRFRLRLTPRERARLMDRIWDLERLGSFEYQFFSQNCATALVWLVSGAMDRGSRVELPSAPWVLPAAVLDQLAAAELSRRGEAAGPLLEHIPGTLLSTGSRARNAHERRERLVARLPEPLRRIHEASLEPDPAVRRRAYEELPDAVSGAGTSRAAYEWLALTARIERYLADRAAHAAREARAGDLEQEAPQERLERRRAWLKSDPSRTRRLSALVWESGFPPEAYDGPRTAAEATFYRFTEIQGRLVERHWPDVDPRAWLEAEDDRAAAAEASWSRRTVPRSGASRRVLGFGVAGVDPAFLIGGAPLGTYLGEALGHGYRPETEVRIMDGRAWLVPTGGGWPEVARSDVTFLGLRTIGRDLPAARRGLFDHLGWSLAIRWDREPDHPFADRLAVDGELLWIADNHLRASSHTLLGAGFSAQGRWSGSELAPAVAPTLSLSHRTPLGGSLMNALTLEARAAPAAVFSDLRPELDLEAETRASLDLYVGRAFDRALIAGPEIHLSYRPQAGHRPRAAAFFRAHIL